MTTDTKADDWIAVYNDGVAHFQAGRLEEAENRFRAAAAAMPAHSVIRLNHGFTLKLLGRRDEALASFRAVLERDANNVDALYHYAALLVEGRRADVALPVLLHLVRIRPDYPAAYLTLGNAFMALDDPWKAEAAYRNAVVVDPGDATAINNGGAAMMSQNRPDAAAVPYRRGVRLVPSSPEYHKNLGTCRLMAGDFQEGGREYEWRDRQVVWKWRRDFPGKERWDGVAPIAGRTVLIHFEQGIGDSFQFIRYASVLRARGARAVFECQKPLKRLLSSYPELDGLVAYGEPLPDFDLYAPLMSLPYLTGTTPRTVPGGVPYLQAEPELAAAWGKRMAAGEFRVGINWHANEVARSIPLELFEAVARIPGVRLYSLQKVVGMDQLDRLRDRLGIVDWTEAMDSGPDGFVDTAAVMANMDLIISCDTAVNHLAGAMGLPTILVLRWFADWRWMLLPETSPYYPTMRLFRMARRNDWGEVMERVAGEVARRAAARVA